MISVCLDLLADPVEDLGLHEMAILLLVLLKLELVLHLLVEQHKSFVLTDYDILFSGQNASQIVLEGVISEFAHARSLANLAVILLFLVLEDYFPVCLDSLGVLRNGIDFAALRLHGMLREQITAFEMAIRGGLSEARWKIDLVMMEALVSD